MSEWTIHYNSMDLMHTLQEAGVAAMPSFSSEEILADPHIKAREKLVEVEHPYLGKKVVVTPPWKMSGTPAVIHKASPLLGENNKEVFKEWVGLTEEEIETYIQEEVIY